MTAVTALQTRRWSYSRKTLIAQAHSHGVVLTGRPSEDCWRSEVWDVARQHRTVFGEDNMPLSVLRLWLRWRLAEADGWWPPESLRYCADADEMILDALNSEDSGFAVYQLPCPLQ